MYYYTGDSSAFNILAEMALLKTLVELADMKYAPKSTGNWFCVSQLYSLKCGSHPNAIR